MVYFRRKTRTPRRRSKIPDDEGIVLADANNISDEIEKALNYDTEPATSGEENDELSDRLFSNTTDEMNTTTTSSNIVGDHGKSSGSCCYPPSGGVSPLAGAAAAATTTTTTTSFDRCTSYLSIATEKIQNKSKRIERPSISSPTTKNLRRRPVQLLYLKINSTSSSTFSNDRDEQGNQPFLEMEPAASAEEMEQENQQEPKEEKEDDDENTRPPTITTTTTTMGPEMKSNMELCSDMVYISDRLKLDIQTQYLLAQYNITTLKALSTLGSNEWEHIQRRVRANGITDEQLIKLVALKEWIQDFSTAKKNHFVNDCWKQEFDQALPHLNEKIRKKKSRDGGGSSSSSSLLPSSVSVVFRTLAQCGITSSSCGGGGGGEV
eukprot:scaffold4979_cov73-Cylindrotheca_fusiformis.AAC.9